jgi:hypothetical protein
MQEDPTGEFLAGVIAQEGVNSIHWGAARLRSGGEAVVEGVEGFGDAFMLGEKPPEVLPETVLREVGEMLQQAWDAIGVGGIEWAHDGERVWLLQLHSGRDSGHGQVIVPGTPGREVTFRVADGLERLRQLVNELGGQDVGVVLDGQVGVTSHFGDVLRRAGIPARVGGG